MGSQAKQYCAPAGRGKNAALLRGACGSARSAGAGLAPGFPGAELATRTGSRGLTGPLHTKGADAPTHSLHLAGRDVDAVHELRIDLHPVQLHEGLQLIAEGLSCVVLLLRFDVPNRALEAVLIHAECAVSALP